MATNLQLQSSVANFQSKVLPLIFKDTEQRQNIENNHFFEKFVALDRQLIVNALGDIGHNVVEYLSKTDLNHPDLNIVFTQRLCKWWDQIIEAYKACNNLNLIQNHLKTLLPFDLKGEIDQFKRVAKSQTCIRLVNGAFERNSLRSLKTDRIIDLAQFYKKGLSAFNSSVSSFDIYMRWSEEGQNQIRKAKDKAEKYSKIGCDFLKTEIVNSLQGFEVAMQDNFYGFARLPMASAAVILAKFHSFKSHQTDRDIDYGHFRIMIPASLFAAYDHLIFGKYGVPLGYGYKADLLLSPRVYPIHEFIQSEKTNKVIQHLEALPELNGKPAFDHYAVLVPTVATSEKYQADFDRMMVSEKFVFPILLGERDGKGYFICFWE